MLSHVHLNKESQKLKCPVVHALLHDMIEGYGGEFDARVGKMSEGLVQPGGAALGALQADAGATMLLPRQTDVNESSNFLAALIERYALAGTTSGKAITDDPRSPFSCARDKQPWSLHAHIDEYR